MSPWRRAKRRGGDGLLWALLAGGCLAVCAGVAVTPVLAIRMSPDGQISPTLLHVIKAGRVLAVLAGGLLLTWACWRLRGWRLGVPVLVVAAAGAVAMVQHVYPHHLLFRPQAVLGAAVGEEMLLGDYDPRSLLAVPSHEVMRAKYPVINIHAHLIRGGVKSPEEILRIMDACNIERTIDLDGGLGESLQAEVDRYATAYPERFVMFAQFGFTRRTMNWDAFPRRVARLDQAKAMGVRGVKIWKNLGLHTRDTDGKRLAIDDPRLEPLWTKLGEVKLPILIHVADPQANFNPVDRHNERYEWLKSVPHWTYGPEFPSPMTLLKQFEHVVQRHPEVTFILAHFGNLAERLADAGDMLERYPNLHMDLSARVQELGRQPNTAREFFIRYQDRLLFATDGNPDESIYRPHFRFLETSDEYFDYPFWPTLNFGRWKIYGLHLPDEVLRKVYHDNAAKLLGLPSLAEIEGRRR